MGSVLFRFFRVVFHPHKLQIQVVNQHPDLFMDLRGEVLRHGGEGSIGPGIGGTVPAYEPVRNVDVGFVVFRLAVFDQEVGHGVGEALQLGEFLVPGLVAVNVRECRDGAPLQDIKPGVNLGLAAGGQPDELGDEAGADDGGLLAFYQGNRLLRKEWQQVFAEEALYQRPFLRKLACVFHQGMHPGDAAFGVLVLDAVAGLGVVFHDLAGPAASLDVNLVEDDGFLTRDPDAVFLDEGGNRYRVEEVRRKVMKSESRVGRMLLATMSSEIVSTLSTRWTGGQGGRWWTDLSSHSGVLRQSSVLGLASGWSLKYWRGV